ncbi:hypothetical protein AYO47_00850 [Planctomyces sp. SCGC AG-212-M04]|nr:hypothetical protein AYO47_00850 [Planctomyces sp. SCGC AG-212-M04]
MSFRPYLIALCGFALLSGCSGEPAKPPVYPVTGTVTMKDKPLGNARIVFVPMQGGAPASGITDKDGKYSLTTYTAGDGAQAGSYGVRVAKYDGTPPPEVANEPPKVLTYEEEQRMQFADEKPTPVAKSVLPKKYGNEGTSGLSHTVKDAPTTFDIKID